MDISQKLIKIIALCLCLFEDIDAEIECHPLESDTRDGPPPHRYATAYNSQKNGSGKIEIIMLATLDFTCIIMYYPSSITEKITSLALQGWLYFQKWSKTVFCNLHKNLQLLEKIIWIQSCCAWNFQQFDIYMSSVRSIIKKVSYRCCAFPNGHPIQGL